LELTEIKAQSRTPKIGTWDGVRRAPKLHEFLERHVGFVSKKKKKTRKNKEKKKTKKTS
jgi:hypothetical protein